MKRVKVFLKSNACVIKEEKHWLIKSYITKFSDIQRAIKGNETNEDMK